MGVKKLAAWMGLVEDDRYRDEAHDDGDLTDDIYVDEESEEMSKVAPLPTRRPTAVAAVPQPEVADLSRIVSVRPRSYNEARVIGENFRDGIPVIMNLTDMSDADAKRLVDFAAGLVFGLRGSIERVTSKVFLLSPETVEVNAEEGPIAASGRGVFNQS